MSNGEISVLNQILNKRLNLKNEYQIGHSAEFLIKALRPLYYFRNQTLIKISMLVMIF